jgi:hypothetical protein
MIATTFKENGFWTASLESKKGKKQIQKWFLTRKEAFHWLFFRIWLEKGHGV